LPVRRWVTPQGAPWLVVFTVILLLGFAVIAGTLFPAPRPRIGNSSAGEAASLPNDHPPIQVPEEVRRAIAELVDKAKAEPDNLDLWRQLAQVQYRAGLLESGYLDAAETAYQHLLAKAPQDLEALRGLGNIAYERQQPAVALDYYRRYLELKPDDPEVRTDFGTMLLASGKAEEAIRTYLSVLEKNPQFFQAHFNLGVAYHGAGKMDEALAAFRKARELAPNERIQQEIDSLLARLGAAPEENRPQPAASAPPRQEYASFQAAAEAVFRDNPVMGKRVERVEWQGEHAARVYLRDFPMAQMGDAMRAMFRDRMLGRLREQKARFAVSEPVRFELVDVQSGEVMETLSEPQVAN